MSLISDIISALFSGYVNVSAISMAYISFHPSLLLYQCSFFPLSSLRSLYKASFCIRTVRLKYGVVLLTSCIPRISVALFLQFVFVITNNKIKCCSRNESFYPILHYHFILRYSSIDISKYTSKLEFFFFDNYSK
jgi:hypothetical protein